ncbi:uncharacterized protein LOC144375036 [Ictidomys tridecemlineatus]
MQETSLLNFLQSQAKVRGPSAGGGEGRKVVWIGRSASSRGAGLGGGGSPTGWEMERDDGARQQRSLVPEWSQCVPRCERTMWPHLVTWPHLVKAPPSPSCTRAGDQDFNPWPSGASDVPTSPSSSESLITKLEESFTYKNRKSRSKDVTFPRSRSLQGAGPARTLSLPFTGREAECALRCPARTSALVRICSMPPTPHEALVPRISAEAAPAPPPRACPGKLLFFASVDTVLPQREARDSAGLCVAAPSLGPNGKKIQIIVDKVLPPTSRLSRRERRESTLEYLTSSQKLTAQV